MDSSFSEEDSRDAQLEMIFRTHVADLYRYIYRQINDTVVAEDLTSAVFLKALRWLQQNRSPESVKGWLYATARSTIADYWREHTQMHLLPLEAVDEEQLPIRSEERDEQLRPLHARVQRILDKLPARERDILTLRFFQGYSTAEISQVLGISANYVRVLQLRALRRAAVLKAEERNVLMETPILPYNEQALRVLELTKEEARSLNHNYIGTEHLLLGILREGSAAPELIKQGITAERMRGGIVFILKGYSQGVPSPNPGFTPRTQQVLVMAGEEAQRLGETAISPYHLLVAILREGQGIAAGLLRASEVRWEQVGERMQISVVQNVEDGPPIVVPTDLQEALQRDAKALAIFEKLSYSKKKRIVEHIEHADGEAARKQQIEKAIELLKSASVVE